MTSSLDVRRAFTDLSSFYLIQTTQQTRDIDPVLI